MTINPNELEIIGAWTMINGRMTEDETSHRIHLLVQEELRCIATAADGWEKLYRDPLDGRLWELTYPNGEMQGGGPPTLVLIGPGKALEKYKI
ncbi:MAG: Imm27 family immunity protein [Terracidiphilus sp.]|jgi:hypothetical protein